MNPEENNLNSVPTSIQSTPTPQAPLAQPTADVKVPNRIGLAIISFFLFWPLGIAAFINSSRVKKCLASGDIAGAQEASGRVKTIGIWSFGIGAIMIACFVAAFGIINAATAAPLKASEQFLSYIANDDAEAAYALTSTEFQAATSESDFASFVSLYKVIDFENAKVKSKEVSSNDTYGDVAEIGYEASSTTQDFTVTTYLIKSGDNWLIQNFSIKVR